MRTRPLQGIIIALACVLAVHTGAFARGEPNPDVRSADLPPQAQQTLQRIASRGPFPFDRDGVVFGNRERALPERSRGYYHEYTVKTPGVRSRGARRIVCGGEPGSTRDCYYSDDHYQTFKRIR